MPKRLFQILSVLGLIAVIVAISLLWFIKSDPDFLKIEKVTGKQEEKILEVSFFDVGQGDAVLIKTPGGKKILIDGGPDSLVVNRMSEVLPWWDRQIDLIILSHPHDDHVSGLIDVVKRYQIGQIVYTGVLHTSPNFLEWLRLAQKDQIPFNFIEGPQKINLGDDCFLEILYPFESLFGKEVEDLNNSSIVMKLVYGETSFLFAGDAELEIEEELLSSGMDFKANVFKASHHGSNTSNSEDFIKAIDPGLIIIQVGEDNSFGHPSPRVLKRIERMGIEVLRNDFDGTIVVNSDGTGVWRE